MVAGPTPPNSDIEIIGPGVWDRGSRTCGRLRTMVVSSAAQGMPRSLNNSRGYRTPPLGAEVKVSGAYPSQ